ncbi:MAG: hypothetical protein M1338_04610 [Patescibacteria group bacterium]|nr:hypothetical protein [Patescibacteria group bacterium]
MTGAIIVGGYIPHPHPPDKPPCKGKKPHHISGPAENCPKDAEGMPGHRDRNKDGKLRAKSGTTLVETLIRKDHVEFPPYIMRHDTLGMLRDITGKKDIHDVAKTIQKMPYETYMIRRNDWIQENEGKDGKAVILNLKA